MITNFELFERQDIEKAQVIRKASEIIVDKLKKHITDAVEKSVEIPYEFNLSPNFDCEIKLPFGMGRAAYSYNMHKNDEKRFLIIKDDALSSFRFFHNQKIRNEPLLVGDGPEYEPTKFEQINWDEIRGIIYHELTHRYDDLKHDIQKVSGTLVNIYGKMSGSTKEYQKAYTKQYPKNTAEYNAYFISAINYLKDDIKNGKYGLPNNFTDFKADFENYIGTNYSSGQNYNFFRESEKFRKHLNKRIFDLWIKIKEKGIAAL